MSSFGCCPLGLLEVELEEATTKFTWGELKNASHPGSTYAIIRVTGGTDSDVWTLQLPSVSDDDDSYTIEVENRSDGAILIASDAGGDSFTLDAFTLLEKTLEDEIQDAAESTFTYRTAVRVTTGGAYRGPGFSGA